jgi:ABC-type branched-subunit amino acid transport system ATPase component
MAASADQLEDLLVITEVAKRFGAVTALAGVSLRLGRGEARGVIGPNGSGKSSLLNCVAGHYRPSSGHIVYKGSDITTDAVGSSRRRGIARTFQNLQLAPSLTLTENVMLGLQRVRLAGRRKTEAYCRERAHAALSEWGFAKYAQAYPEAVPYGIRKIVETVRAVLAEPELILLDEPAAGLSPDERSEFLAHFNEFYESHKEMSVVLVEHDIAFVQKICGTLTVLDYGNVVRTGESAQVMTDPEVIGRFLGRPPNGA